MSKKLEYSQHTPAFLQRLKAGISGADGRSNVKQIRPGRSRLKTSDENGEDEPVVVDERGETVVGGLEKWMGVQKEDAQEERGEGDEDGKEEAGEEQQTERAEREKQRVAGIGGAKKRKVGKIVGGEGVEKDDLVRDEDKAKGVKRRAVDGREQASNGVESNVTSDKKSEAPKLKKKAKKIKLSFDDPE